MRISDWSSDVCSSDLMGCHCCTNRMNRSSRQRINLSALCFPGLWKTEKPMRERRLSGKKSARPKSALSSAISPYCWRLRLSWDSRSEEHKSEIQSLMRNSYAALCLKKKKHNYNYN